MYVEYWVEYDGGLGEEERDDGGAVGDQPEIREKRYAKRKYQNFWRENSYTIAHELAFLHFTL